jgi:hypothetical protein
MAHRIVDRVQQTTSSTGTGALLLDGTVTKMLTFLGAGFTDGDTFRGLIENQASGVTEWEISICTYAAGAITRTTFLKSSTGATVNFSAGTKTVTLVDSAIGRDAVDSPTITAGALAFDLSKASSFNVALNANATVSFNNAFAAGLTGAFTALFTADGTQRTLIWPAAVVWPFGAPTPTSANGKRDLYNFLSLDGGTTVLGFAIAQGF